MNSELKEMLQSVIQEALQPVHQRLDRMESKIGQMESKIDQMENKLVEIQTDIQVLKTGQQGIRKEITTRFAEIKEVQERQERLLERLSLRSIEQEIEISDLRRAR